MKNVFDDLCPLGFEYTNINIYESEEKKIETTEKKHTTPLEDMLYFKTVTCPVCNTTFKVLAVKASYYKIKSRDSDLYIHYDKINPYLYDPWVCENCGYAAMKSDFFNLKDYEIDLIKENICSKWKKKNYSIAYTTAVALEKYKLCLISAVESKSRSSKKAMICLKIAWMYRISCDEDFENHEKFFLEQALKGFELCYTNEALPVYGMDIHTLRYLIGELNRRLGNNEKAISWFGKVIVAPGIKQSLKNMARTQKDLCKQTSI
ncbi:hypothetical protein SAMN02745248_01324 [Hathewaya proteolytica DSM 3090]|uniref:DUF2225 domain-containing protein n=1 Tax=Hathewaya proteolytica DSM 3090 TaxID=1121331 RepID=A0A1M6N931_9CLOT|nr:DUF2225 domain-containing protein [Hathewaya proteolytica]SHJ92199.1 hypothetical protein SAMN02745248_01324 [Hathewaya proteolytica DSM 3090]